MAIRTYEIILDAKNDILPEIIFGRQGDKTGAVQINGTIVDGGFPYNLTGKSLAFKATTAKGTAIVADSNNFNIVDASNGKFTYLIPNALWSEAGRIDNAYFSVYNVDEYQAESTLGLILLVKKAVDMTQERANDYITIVDQTIKDLAAKLEGLRSNVDQALENFSNGDFYNKKYIDDLDKSTETQIIDLQNNAYLKRYHGLMEKQSVVFSLKMVTSSDKLYPQSAAIDQEHDAVFVVFENDDASSQILRKYKLSDSSFVSENDLKLPANSWIEGLSLTFNSDNEACFIINTNAELQQFKIYNYDKNTYSDVFTLIGSWKLNISDDHAYLVTASGSNVVNINDGITSINLYDLTSVMLAKPKLIKTIPVSNYDVHGRYKLQGLAMINEQIILGRGANVQTPRITVLDINGNVIEDYIFNSDNLLDLAQVKSSAPWSLENEGICYFVDAGITHPVAVDVYWDKSTTQLILFKMGDVNDKIVEQENIPLKDNSTTASELLVNPKGMSISVGKNNISILDVLVRLDRIGVFTISSENGNSGNPLGATTLTGFATVKTVDSNRASRISVIAQDNNNVYYTNYYDVNANGWNGWQQLSGTVPYINPTSPVFDPLVQKTGSYLTKSSKNSPAFTNGAPDDVKLYDVKITSRGDKLIRCYNPTRNETFQAFIWAGTTDLVWQKVEQTIKA